MSREAGAEQPYEKHKRGNQEDPSHQQRPKEVERKTDNKHTMEAPVIQTQEERDKLLTLLGDQLGTKVTR